MPLSLLFAIYLLFLALNVGSLGSFADIVPGGGPAVLRACRAVWSGAGGFRRAGTGRAVSRRLTSGSDVIITAGEQRLFQGLHAARRHDFWDPGVAGF